MPPTLQDLSIELTTSPDIAPDGAERDDFDAALNDVPITISCRRCWPVCRPARQLFPAASSTIRPRHTSFLQPHEIADRAFTNAEWLEFMADDGYDDPRLWLSDGWAWRQSNYIAAPLYWREEDGD